MLRKIDTHIKNESGTTLVELLAAIAILSIIVTAFLAFFVQGARTNNRTNDLTQATFIAQEEMEEMVYYSRTLSFSELSDENQGNFTESNGKLTRSYPADGYSVTTTITKTENMESLFTVIVEVRNADGLQAMMENRLTFE